MKIEIKNLSEKYINLAFALCEINEDIGNRRIDIRGMKERLTNENFHVIVANVENKVVGGLIAYRLRMFNRDESKIFLYEIDVEEDYRRKGIGSLLITELTKLSKSLNVKSIFICTDADNIAAQNLYEKMGGEVEMIPMYSFRL